MFGKKLTIQQVNYLNIGLMILSFACALVKPFETFLFVYAFLGPLHYLTEISWLHDKKYFTKRRYDYLFLLAIGVFIWLIDLNVLKNVPQGADTFVIFLAFVAAFIFAVTSNWKTRIIFLIVAMFAANFISHYASYEAIFGAFLPTLIHVFIFTGLFILVGALRGRDLSGILSLVVFVGITVAIFTIKPDVKNYQVSKYVKNSYGTMMPYRDAGGNYYKDPSGFDSVAVVSDGHGFISLNNTIRQVFNLHKFGSPNMSYDQFVASVNNYFYASPFMLALMIFIGFAYMYHYLNWFSKTSVIQWHNIPRSRFVAIIILWLASVGLYAYDYSVGLKWLFFLSFTHVLLEFPLNHITFINIGKEVKNIVTKGKFAKG